MAGSVVVAVIAAGLLGTVVGLVSCVVLMTASFGLLAGSRHADHGANSDPFTVSGPLSGP
jgi:hypothetical protein